MSGRALVLLTVLSYCACIIGLLLLMDVAVPYGLVAFLVFCPLMLLYGLSFVCRIEVNDTELAMETLFRRVRVPWTSVLMANRAFGGRRLRIFVNGYWGAFDVAPTFIREFSSVAAKIEEHVAEAKRAKREMK